MAVFLNQGGGVFTGPFNYDVGGVNPGPVVLVDFDCDGDRDVAAANRDSNNVSVLLNRSAGCVTLCGDAFCDVGENQCNCPADCGSPPVSEVAGSTCQDGIDNDCDTLADCADADCGTDPGCAGGCLTDTECNDGILCTVDRCVGGICSNTNARYGDIAGPGGSCGPDGLIDLQDILAVLDAFGGDPRCNGAP